VKKFIVFLLVLSFLALNTAVAFAESGAALFNSSGCIACHTVGRYGGYVGPNLSNIGRNKSLSWLKVQIYNPSAHFPAGSSATINGKTYIAIMPSYSRRLSKFKINAIAEYLKSLGKRRQVNVYNNTIKKGNLLIYNKTPFSNGTVLYYFNRYWSKHSKPSKMSNLFKILEPANKQKAESLYYWIVWAGFKVGTHKIANKTQRITGCFAEAKTSEFLKSNGSRVSTYDIHSPIINLKDNKIARSCNHRFLETKKAADEFLKPKLGELYVW